MSLLITGGERPLLIFTLSLPGQAGSTTSCALGVARTGERSMRPATAAGASQREVGRERR